MRIAAIMNDKERALARGGAGAVMGSKNLKAIVVAGKEKNQPADKDQFKFMQYETGKLLKASPLTSQALPEFGTAVVMNVVNEIGALPTRNFQQTQFEGRRQNQRRGHYRHHIGEKSGMLGVSHYLYAHHQNRKRKRRGRPRI